jgi:hypothetical protein
MGTVLHGSYHERSSQLQESERLHRARYELAYTFHVQARKPISGASRDGGQKHATTSPDARGGRLGSGLWKKINFFFREGEHNPDDEKCGESEGKEGRAA